MTVDINNIIDQAVIGLASDDARDGVDQLYELAIQYKSAGLPSSSFADICGYIENQAIAMSDEHFVKEKISIALRKVRESKGRHIMRCN